MSGQAAQMNQVGGSGVGGGTDGLPQDHQMQDVVRLGMGIDPQFVMLRNNMREKIFEYIGRKRSSADRRRRLPELAWRLDEILFRKFPDKNEYYNMRKLRVEPQLQFAIKTSNAQLRKMPDLLVHASTCRSGSCQYPNCPEVKGLFRHGKQCQIRASGGCALCKKMWSTLQLHARACRDSGCSVPRCRDLKEHLTRLQQLSDSSRRAAVMK